VSRDLREGLTLRGEGGRLSSSRSGHSVRTRVCGTIQPNAPTLCDLSNAAHCLLTGTCTTELRSLCVLERKRRAA